MQVPLAALNVETCSWGVQTATTLRLMQPGEVQNVNIWLNAYAVRIICFSLCFGAEYLAELHSAAPSAPRGLHEFRPDAAKDGASAWNCRSDGQQNDRVSICAVCVLDLLVRRRAVSKQKGGSICSHTLSPSPPPSSLYFQVWKSNVETRQHKDVKSGQKRACDPDEGRAHKNGTKRTLASQCSKQSRRRTSRSSTRTRSFCCASSASSAWVLASIASPIPRGRAIFRCIWTAFVS